MKDSRIPNDLLRFESVSFQLITPVNNKKEVETMKGNSFSWYIRAISMHDDMNTPSSIRTMPRICIMPLKFMSAGLPTLIN